jgi:hypothetical protein
MWLMVIFSKGLDHGCAFTHCCIVFKPCCGLSRALRELMVWQNRADRLSEQNRCCIQSKFCLVTAPSWQVGVLIV